MAGPLDVVRGAHVALRRDMAAIDAAAVVAAQGGPGIEATVERFHFFNQVLERHAEGEEAGLFPALEKVAPSVAGAYEIDHRGLDLAFDGLTKAITARDPLGTARATAAFKFHLDLHLHKEEVHLLPLLEERLSLPELGAAMSQLGSVYPVDEMPEFVQWMFRLVDVDDSESILRAWQVALPAAMFAGIVSEVRVTVGDDFAELTRRIPELADA